jgi:hypothetical protein
MADFRNRLLFVAGMATIFAGLSSAQSLTCAPGQAPGAPNSGYPGGAPAGTAANLKGEYGPVAGPGSGISPTQPIELRSEGVTELVSDTVFVCVGTGGTTLQGQVTAFMSGNVPGLAVTGYNPVLQVIDNSGGEHGVVYYAGTLVPGTSNVVFGTSGTAGKTGIYTNGVVTFPSYNFILQVSNIRVNVTGLLNPTVPTPVTETVFAGAEGVASLFNPIPETVGFVLKSFTATVSGVNNYVVCLANPGQDDGGSSFGVTVTELFAGAFKTPDAPAPTEAIPAPANIPGGEQGSFPSAETVTILGTRFKFVIANIPAGVTAVSVPTAIYGTVGGASTLELDLVTGGDTGTSGAVIGGVGTIPSTALAPVGGSVTVVYQVNTELLSVIKSFVFAPQLQFAANAIIGAQPAITVTTSYAPSPATPGGAIVVPTTYLPYFANTGTPVNASLFNPCETDLLFPFITTQNGFETGIAISNTASDPFGTTGQPGVCNLYFYGTGQAPAATSPVTPTATAMTSIAVGKTQDTVVSPYLGANYLGYVIARCQFLYAHGFAFFTNAAPGITAAQQAGYTALVFPLTPGKARSAPNPSENLNN